MMEEHDSQKGYWNYHFKKDVGMQKNKNREYSYYDGIPKEIEEMSIEELNAEIEKERQRLKAQDKQTGDKSDR